MLFNLFIVTQNSTNKVRLETPTLCHKLYIVVLRNQLLLNVNSHIMQSKNVIELHLIEHLLLKKGFKYMHPCNMKSSMFDMKMK